MMKPEKQKPQRCRGRYNTWKEERMEYDLDRLKEMPEDERVEAFAWALGQLTEDELDELAASCADIIYAVEKRRKGGEQ